MTVEQILNQNSTKKEKAFAFYSLGYTRQQVADLLCNGNYGYAHNMWKKWNEIQSTMPLDNVFEFLFNRRFGVEIEFFGAAQSTLERNLRAEGIRYEIERYNHETRNHWKFTTDSSIRGDHPFEMVSPILQGCEGLQSLKKATTALRLSKTNVNTSCGVHIHLEVNDYSLENMKTLVKNFYILEKQFDKMMPESRRNNQYCKGLSILGSKDTFFSNLNNCRSVREIVNLFNTRYLKLNLQSYLKYGTVEFRQHSGSTKFSKIKNWILICARLVEFSKQNIVLSNLETILNEELTEYFEERVLDFA